MAKPKIVKARYLGGTDIVMPHLEELGGGPHKGLSLVRYPDGTTEFVAPEEIPEGVQVVAKNGAATVHKGDVIPIDEFSAKGREDFEIVSSPERRPPAETKAAAPAAKKEA